MLQNFHAFGDAPPAHPTCQQGLPVSCVRFYALGHLRRVGHSLRRQNDQQAVTVGIGKRHIQRAGIALRVRVAEDIDGIGVAPMRRKECAERLFRFRRQLGEFANATEQCISRKNTGSASVGENRQAWSAWSRLLAKHVGHVKKSGDTVNPQNAATAKSRFINFVASGHGAGMRSRSARSGLRAARFDDNDRLVKRYFPRGRQE